MIFTNTDHDRKNSIFNLKILNMCYVKDIIFDISNFNLHMNFSLLFIRRLVFFSRSILFAH